MDNINSRLEIAYDEFKLKTQQLVSHELNKCHAKQSKYNNTEYIDELISQVLDINQGIPSDTRRYPDSYSEKRPDYTSYDTTSDTSLDINMILQPTTSSQVEQTQIDPVEQTQIDPVEQTQSEPDQQTQSKPGQSTKRCSRYTMLDCPSHCEMDNNTRKCSEPGTVTKSDITIDKIQNNPVVQSTSSTPSEVSPSTNNTQSNKSCSRYTMLDCPSHCEMDNNTRKCIEPGTITKSDITNNKIQNNPVVQSTSSSPTEVTSSTNNTASNKSCSRYTMLNCPSHCKMDNETRSCINPE